MDYLSWNDMVAAKFFATDMKDRRVYLYITSDVIREVGKPANAGVPDFTAAIKKGPSWVTSGGICDRAQQCLHGWRRRRLPYPPYLGYLAFFVLAAGAGRCA